uniref:Uncharacterized protein n=1 Tax=Rhizophora mucronata TaxID=61149 RepID=A0A2P2PAX1_RHIMU
MNRTYYHHTMINKQDLYGTNNKFTTENKIFMSKAVQVNVVCGILLRNSSDSESRVTGTKNFPKNFLLYFILST